MYLQCAVYFLILAHKLIRYTPPATIHPGESPIPLENPTAAASALSVQLTPPGCQTWFPPSTYESKSKGSKTNLGTTITFYKLISSSSNQCFFASSND